MRRREFITLFGGAVAASPLTKHAQPKRLPVVALVLSSPPANQMVGSDPVSPPTRGFLQGLYELGWVDGRNLIVERRSAESDPRRAPVKTAGLAVAVFLAFATTEATALCGPLNCHYNKTCQQLRAAGHCAQAMAAGAPTLVSLT
jgi:putative ABC transport system substrate-binding protein